LIPSRVIPLAVAGLLAVVAPGPHAGPPDSPPAGNLLLTQAVIRVPTSGFIRPGEPITGSVTARVVLRGEETREAAPSELAGFIQAGSLRVPFQGGLFVLPSVPPGQTTLQAFGPMGAGAELGRVLLIAPEAIPPAPETTTTPGDSSAPPGDSDEAVAAPAAAPGTTASAEPMEAWRIPLASLPRERILVRGSFAGRDDAPELRIAGRPCALVWESMHGALFRGPEPGAEGPGATGDAAGAAVELRLRGAVAARGKIYLPEARFAIPDPAEVTGRGMPVQLSADVRGLPLRPRGKSSDASGAPLGEVVFINLDPAVLVDLWSMSPGTRNPPGRLIVPIRPEMVSAEGSFIVRATAKGRAKGAVKVDGTLILSPELSGALQPLEPVSP
jgi:hypothetical protein